MQKPFFIPADVPPSAQKDYENNYAALTKDTERFFLFAADHKIEHLDDDFHGTGIDPAAHHPEHLFAIAGQARIGALATQLGLIARYGSLYPKVNYVVKLNSKTNLVPSSSRDPLSRQLWTVQDVINFKEQSGLNIRGIGLTVYLGSEYEDSMLSQAAQAVIEAHRQGLIAILWMYPRGKYIKNERDAHLLAGAVGVATSLGADVAKIHPPHATKDASRKELLRFIIEAAGNTKVICAGGTGQKKSEVLLNEISQQLNAGCAGAAIGRTIFKHSLKDAVELANTIATRIYDTEQDS